MEREMPIRMMTGDGFGDASELTTDDDDDGGQKTQRMHSLSESILIAMEWIQMVMVSDSEDAFGDSTMLIRTPMTDDDGDGVIDSKDAFPLDSTETLDTMTKRNGDHADG